MDFFEVVQRRHSYRGEFLQQPIPQEDVHRILDAGIRAPSGHNRQTTRFLVVQSSALRKGISEIYPHKGIASAPVHIIILSRHEETFKGKAFEVQDYSACMENILLAITACGYASVWIEGALLDDGRAERMCALLDVEAGWTLRAVLPVGIPVSEGTQAEKLPFEERVKLL